MKCFLHPEHLYLGCSMFLLFRNLYLASVELQNGHVLVTPTYMAGSMAVLGLSILGAKSLFMTKERIWKEEDQLMVDSRIDKL